MRGALLVVVAVQVLLLTSCKKLGGPASGQVTTVPAGDECEPSNKPSNKPICANLLPDNWEQSNQAQLASLVVNIIPSIPLHSEVVQDREIAADCVKRKPKVSERITVGYQVPKAMSVFPITGTRSRDLVIGVMVEKKPNNNESKCWSARYSVQEKLGNGNRALMFLTVRTDSGGHIAKVNRQVGQWRSWTISKVNGNEYELVNTGTGAFVSCAHEHYVGQPNVTHQFISCKTVALLMAQAKLLAGDPTRQARNPKLPAGDPTSSAVAVAFDRLMLAYRTGNAEGVSNTGPTDSAWSRCGNLGCCAAE